jgi:hypothetical protein
MPPAVIPPEAARRKLGNGKKSSRLMQDNYRNPQSNSAKSSTQKIII